MGVTTALSGAVTPEQVGAAVAEHGARALGGTGGVVYVVAGAQLRVISTWGYDEALVESFRTLPLAAETPVTDAARERRTITDHRPYEALGEVPHGSLCAVPLLAGDQVLGAVGVSRSDGRAFAEAEWTLLEALARQGGAALERARLYARLNSLQATTAELARALTPQEVAAAAAAQGAELVGAASAWVALLGESQRSLDLVHAYGHGAETRERFRSLPLDAQLPMAHAVRIASALWMESPEEIFGPFPRFREIRPQAQALALLPLSDGGAALGAIGLAFDAPYTFGPADRDFLLALTRLCGQALGRARRYQSEHEIALSLQQALLPDSLPQSDGLALAVRYLPAADGAAAGGDFYDAIELSGGRVGIAVGDIVGHGPQAAAAMGQLRSALRAYALEGRAPARILQLLSRYADGVPGARGATVTYAVVDPGARELRYASAGHPPPLVISGTGEATFLNGARGVPLDRALGHIYVDATASLPESSTLILYSDGAIERRGEPLDTGMDRLARAAALHAGIEPEILCDRLLEALGAAERRRDDVALLAARVGAPAVAPLRMWFAARADQLSVVREAMRSWLSSAGVEGGDTEILVLAAGELCANAVEHAYAGAPDGSVEVALGREAGGVLTLVVRDRGRWRPPPANPGMRGRGLGIVRALMHVVDIDEGVEGTTVSVRYRPGQTPAPTGSAVHGPATVSLTRHDGLPVARIQGEIDGANADHIADQLLVAGPGPMIVDLSAVGYLASAGLRVLFTLAQHSGTLAIVVPPDAPFRRAIEIAELGRAALITDTLDAALEDLRRP